LNALTPEQLAVLFGVLVCSAFAWWLGGLFAYLSREGVFLFLRRSPRWRRFDRAMRKVMA
jgi:hypothetical protein